MGDPAALTYNVKMPEGGGETAAAKDDGTGVDDDDLVCTCIGLTKKHIVDAVSGKDATTIPLLKKCTKVGTGCGGCCTPVGEVPRVLAATLKAMGKTVATGICPHFAFSRRELFDIIKVKKIRSFPEALETLGTGEGC